MSREQAISAIDPWLIADGSLHNLRMLCLAAGGGTHGPLLAMAGADVVVVDFSLSLLQIDKRIAEQSHLRLRTVHIFCGRLISIRIGIVRFRTPTG